MIIDDKKIDFNDLTKNIFNDNAVIKKRKNDIYLSDEQIEILKRYNIDYKKYSSLNSLLFQIETILNEESNIEELEEVSKKLAELNYYNNTNK